MPEIVSKFMFCWQNIFEILIFKFFSGHKTAIIPKIYSTNILGTYEVSYSDRSAKTLFCVLKLNTEYARLYTQINKKFRVTTEIGSTFFACWSVTGQIKI
jgi:hypothetical protein